MSFYRIVALICVEKAVCHGYIYTSCLNKLFIFVQQFLHNLLLNFLQSNQRTQRPKSAWILSEKVCLLLSRVHRSDMRRKISCVDSSALFEGERAGRTAASTDEHRRIYGERGLGRENARSSPHKRGHKAGEGTQSCDFDSPT